MVTAGKEKREFTDADKAEYGEKLKKGRRLKLSSQPKDLKEIIRRVLYGREATYYLVSGKANCNAYRARTIEDTFQVARTYIPDVTYAQVHDAVLSLNNIYRSYCSVIKRFVYLPVSSNPKLKDDLNIPCKVKTTPLSSR